MTEPTADSSLPLEQWQAIAEKSQRLMRDFVARQGDGVGQNDDMKRMNDVFMQATMQLLSDPAKLAEAQASLWKGYMDLWQNTALRMAGQEVDPVVLPHSDDRRFKHDSWTENAVFDYMKQSYLLSSNWVTELMGGVDGLEPKTKKQLDFYTRLYVDALSPTNFAATNPEVLRETAETKGENLVRGLSNLLDDFERGKGQLAIKMVDNDAFEVGKDLATTPGKVVFQNDLIQLIQFTPTTQKVHRKPLLIVPPWINKYYILDLKPKNSFIKWVVEQGHTVFVVSWVNPDAELARKTFSDYLLEGPMAAIDAVEKATGEKKINVLGYCIGGTLVACTMAYMAANKDNHVASASYLTSLVDFKNVGEIDVFIDEEQVQNLERMMEERGFLEGSEMAATFNTLRANDLVWSFVINNYL
ncbi:MAG: class I poly(R)-hydroxyalkanoic acid synthase, partial [Rhodospirillaceae bacterium]|nr:class I poly(R)-hydroxyalkanoic acid synthase [Rhodospirillaceae bacterium]